MTTKRDETMARIAAADVALQNAKEAVSLSMNLFCDPTEDQDGAVREEELETAFMCCHLAAVSLSKAQTAFKEQDEDDLITAEDDNDEEEMEGDSDGEEAGEE